MPKKFETQAIRSQIKATDYKEHTVPVYLTSSFTFDDPETMAAAFRAENDAKIYSRFDNPNFSDFADKLALLEGTEAGYATSSGMAAIFAVFMSTCNAGDHILSCRSIFGSTHGVLNKWLPRWNINSSYVDLTDTANWDDAVQENTKLLYIETPTNPGIDIIDLEWAGRFAKKHDLLLVVDNCFATPYVQQPSKFGADIIVHSATKFIDGQGRVVGGAVCASKEIIEEVYQFCRATGPSISPFNAWMLSKSLETLAVRMERHCENALALANFLEGHPSVESVNYPGLSSHPQHEIASKQMRNGGPMLAFNLKGGIEKGKAFLGQIKMCSLTANLGDTRTIVSHPSSTTHAKLTEEERIEVGILPGMVRVSVGIEHIDDIIEDIKQALG